jgi:hypothetical protein
MTRVDPPIQRRRDINLVLLATRHVGASLFPITKWPVSVQVCPIWVDHPESRDRFSRVENESIGWAELYRTEQDAQITIG